MLTNAWHNTQHHAITTNKHPQPYQSKLKVTFVMTDNTTGLLGLPQSAVNVYRRNNSCFREAWDTLVCMTAPPSAIQTTSNHQLQDTLSSSKLPQEAMSALSASWLGFNGRGRHASPESQCPQCTKCPFEWCKANFQAVESSCLERWIRLHYSSLINRSHEIPSSLKVSVKQVDNLEK